MTCSQLVAFENTLREILASACIFPLLEASFIIAGYVSDDGFYTFRAWLVSQGVDRFSKAMADPDSIADWLGEDDFDHADGDELLSASYNLFIDGKGDSDAFFRRIVSHPDPLMQQDWPSTKVDFRSKYPKLTARFWNDERVRELH